MEIEQKIKELEKRIAELEKRPQYIQHYPIIPQYIHQQPYRCPICGSTGGCWHITSSGGTTNFPTGHN